MISKMYPDRMPSEKLQKNVDEFYKLSYGRSFAPEQLGY